MFAHLVESAQRPLSRRMRSSFQSAWSPHSVRLKEGSSPSKLWIKVGTALSADWRRPARSSDEDSDGVDSFQWGEGVNHSGHEGNRGAVGIGFCWCDVAKPGGGGVLCVGEGNPDSSQRTGEMGPSSPFLEGKAMFKPDEFLNGPVNCPKCGKAATSVFMTGMAVFYNHGDATFSYGSDGMLAVQWKSCQGERK